MIRVLNFEYWPSYLFYLPLLVYYSILALRARHICFFSAANPGIYLGGNGLESKYDTLQKIPAPYRPTTVFADKKSTLAEIERAIKEKGLSFPLIVKPDIGFRGLLVTKVNSWEALQRILQSYPIHFIIQEFIDYPREFGILYYRIPGASKGTVTSITIKDYLNVVGDGEASLRELIEQKPRALLQLDRLRTTHQQFFDTVPSKGEVIPLGEIGNHSKGTFFQDGNYLIDEQISRTFDEISAGIEGFNYGRFDIKCKSFEDLRKGQHFKIIEVNGVCSEPTHIYDPIQSSYFKAINAIARHWSIIQKISVANHELGVAYARPMTVIRAIRALNGYSKELKKLRSQI